MKPVLIVDDDETMCDALVALLHHAGYAAESAPNGQIALARLRASSLHLPCFILLDLMMPVMDGWELVEHLGKDDVLFRIPFAIMSVHHDLVGLARARQGPTVLLKPLQTEALLELVARHCTKKN